MKEREQDDAGRQFILKLQQHRSKPLWRMVETEITKLGEKRVNDSRWIPFHDLIPQLSMAHRRLQNFVVQLGPNPPVQTRPLTKD